MDEVQKHNLFNTNILALVDSSYCFIYTNTGAAGRKYDGGVFHS